MISEIANSLFLTYLASEYLISSSPVSSSSSSRSRTIQHTAIDNSNNGGNRINCFLLGSLAFVVAIANLVDHAYYPLLVWAYATKLVPKNAIVLRAPVAVFGIPPGYFVIPLKVGVAATSYVLALYADIHRERTTPAAETTEPKRSSSKNGSGKKTMPFRSVFLPKVGWAFLKILPAYPFLAVLFSFGFLFVVDLWELLGLPLEWLNMPIYYGTLYGPFAYTYVHVKREVVRKRHENHYDRNNYTYYHTKNDRSVVYGYGNDQNNKTTDAFV